MSTPFARSVAALAAATTATTLVLVGPALPSAWAGDVTDVTVTVTLGGAAAPGAFVAVRSVTGEAQGASTADGLGVAHVALRAATDESNLRVIAGTPNSLVSAPVPVASSAAAVDLAPVPVTVSSLSYANAYGSQVEDLAGDGQSGVFYGITSTLPSVWRSTDYAGTWSAAPSRINSPSAGLPQSQARQLVTSGYPGEVAVVLQSVSPDNSDQLWYSRDYGTTWAEVSGYRTITGSRTILWAHSATATGPDSSYLIVSSSAEGHLPFVMPSAANGLAYPAAPYATLAGVVSSDQIALAPAPDGVVRLVAAGATDATLSTLPVGRTTTSGMATSSSVTLPFFGRTTSVASNPFLQWGPEDVVKVSSLGTPDHAAVLVYDRGRDSGVWSGVLKTAAVDLSVDPAVVTTNRSGDGSFALAIAPQGNPVEPVAFVTGQTAITGFSCGENETTAVATIADVVPAAPAAGFAFVGAARSCMVAFNASPDPLLWNGTGGSVPVATAAVIPVQGINNNVGFVYDARFMSTNDAAQPVTVAISGDGQFGVRKSAAFDANGRFQFGGAVNTVAAFLTRQASPGPAADSGGVAVRGMVAPSISDEVVSPTDPTGSTYLTSLASSGGAQVLLTTDRGATFSTAAVVGSDRVAWWSGPAGHQWILAEGWDRLRPKPFTTATGPGPLDLGEELAASAAQRNDPTPDGLPFVLPDPPALLGGAGFTYDQLIANRQGRIMMTAAAGVPGTDRVLVGVSDGSSPQSLTRGTVALVDLAWPDDTGSQAGLQTGMTSVRSFGPALPASGTEIDAQAGFGVGASSSYAARINAIAVCPDLDGVAASVRDTAFVSVSGGGIDKITGVSGATPTWSTTGVIKGNYRDLDVDCDTGVLVATPDIPWDAPDFTAVNRLAEVSVDGAQTLSEITPTATTVLPRVGALSIAVAASAVDDQLTIVLGGESGIVAGLVLKLTDIAPGWTSVQVPSELVQIVNGTTGRSVGRVSALDLPVAPSDPVPPADPAPPALQAAPAPLLPLAATVPLAVGSGAGAFSTLARQSGAVRTARLLAPSVTTSLSPSVRVTWASSGVVRTYRVQRAVKAPGGRLGAYAAWLTAPGTLTTYVMTKGLPGYAYCFRVAASYGAGTTAWSVPRCTTVALDDRALKASSGWTRATSRTAYLATITTSRVRNAALTLGIARASSLGVLVTKQPGGGILAVYVNGRRVAFVSTAASSVQARVLVPVKVAAAGVPVVLRVYTTGTRGVIVDGLVPLA